MNLALYLRHAGRPDLAAAEVERLWPLGPSAELASLGAGCAEQIGRRHAAVVSENLGDGGGRYRGDGWRD